MTFVFWQGMISIHQKSFLEAVAARPGVAQVVLVVEHDITPYRKDMGWEVPELANVTLIKSPARQQIKDIVHKHKEAIHIMGGVRVGAMLSAAFDMCVKEHCRLGIMTEPYNDAGLKGKLRTLKYRYYKLRHFRYIQFVLAIGRQGAKQYTRLGFDSRRIFAWAYFISIDKAAGADDSSGKKRLIYAGRLEAAKGIYAFTEELVRAKNSSYTLDIYGAGADEEKLRQLIVAGGAGDNIHIYPFMPYNTLLQQYSRYDWVVLPSAAKDGWGVIVSEGLLNGLKAICSNICGVSMVIKSGENGLVFDPTRPGDMAAAIYAMLNTDTFATPAAISAWAQQGISAEAGAAYLMQVAGCVYDNEKKPAIPWE